MNQHDLPWTDEQVDLLRELWSLGLSSGKIAVRMERSKNAVVGKVHRLNLPARPSPIVRDGPRTPRRAPRAPRVTLPALRVAHAPAPVVAHRPAPAPRYGRVEPCCWPIGEPRKPGFRFCDEASVAGSVYCPVHHATAYVWLPVCREEAAE
jgi:GcrA cell cycle regulator